eukprot:TRINITY_DN24493_c0_g1_i1.p1 TRINITY_DN24493_c0_g1~~TRINITY_DN24493_c0_g1_i1.p1  ORF type:complete len:724 (-),score=71.82 TRINITY_DN24493_c0_g1_i1:6-2177(-)
MPLGIFAHELYKALGLPDGASLGAVRRAYRHQAMKYHPDKNQTAEASDKMAQINHAYAILNDPERKAQYDQTFGFRSVPDTDADECASPRPPSPALSTSSRCSSVASDRSRDSRGSPIPMTPRSRSRQRPQSARPHRTSNSRSYSVGVEGNRSRNAGFATPDPYTRQMESARDTHYSFPTTGSHLRYPTPTYVHVRSATPTYPASYVFSDFEHEHPRAEPPKNVLPTQQASRFQSQNGGPSARRNTASPYASNATPAAPVAAATTYTYKYTPTPNSAPSGAGATVITSRTTTTTLSRQGFSPLLANVHKLLQMETAVRALLKEGEQSSRSSLFKVFHVNTMAVLLVRCEADEAQGRDAITLEASRACSAILAAEAQFRRTRSHVIPAAVHRFGAAGELLAASLKAEEPRRIRIAAAHADNFPRIARETTPPQVRPATVVAAPLIPTASGGISHRRAEVRSARDPPLTERDGRGVSILQNGSAHHATEEIPEAVQQARAAVRQFCLAFSHINPHIFLADPADTTYVYGPPNSVLGDHVAPFAACPITGSRIEIPVRGRHCKHLRCFDLRSFLFVHDPHNIPDDATDNGVVCVPSWPCPFCNQPIRSCDLVVDLGVADALSGVATVSGINRAVAIFPPGVRALLNFNRASVTNAPENFAPEERKRLQQERPRHLHTDQLLENQEEKSQAAHRQILLECRQRGDRLGAALFVQRFCSHSPKCSAED